MSTIKNIVMIPSGGTNISSVQDALEEIGFPAVLSADKKTIEQADKIILPGVGSAAHSMKVLQELNLVGTIQHLEQDVLGICVGMQLLFQHSEEDNQQCLGIIPARIERLPNTLTVPHMGWNELLFSAKKKITLLNNIEEGSFAYFTHSYFAPFNEKYTLAFCEYGNLKLSAMVSYKNFFGMQFHPERSGQVGLQLLKNFFML